MLRAPSWAHAAEFCYPIPSGKDCSRLHRNDECWRQSLICGIGFARQHTARKVKGMPSYVILCIVCIALICFVHNMQAQFWENMFGRCSESQDQAEKMYLVQWNDIWYLFSVAHLKALQKRHTRSKFISVTFFLTFVVLRCVQYMIICMYIHSSNIVACQNHQKPIFICSVYARYPQLLGCGS